MAVYKRGRTYWYEFIVDGEKHRGSTKLRNYGAAKDYEAKVRTEVIEHGVGIVRTKKAPRLSEYVPVVMQAIREEHGTRPRTVEYYDDAFNRVLAYSPLANARLDKIDDELIGKFKSRELKEVAICTANHSLRALRRALRYAYKKNYLRRPPPRRPDTRRAPPRVRSNWRVARGVHQRFDGAMPHGRHIPARHWPSHQ